MAKHPEDNRDGDPRLNPAERPAMGETDALRPSVAAATAPGPWLIIGAAVAMGLLVTLWLAAHRPRAPGDADTLAASASKSAPPASVLAAPPPPPELAAMASEGLPQPVTPLAPAPQPASIAAPPPVAGPSAESAPESGRAPVLVVDFSPPGAFATGASSAAGASKSGPAPPAAAEHLSNDEQFVARLEGGPGPARSSATMLRNQSTLIPQGATIPAVLETALDSDLPGYTRAVVSRDVRGFDASTVLIPRGSRVIGEYHSALAQGQTRAFVIWTRVIRPDGASIQIGSGGGDSLGRAGLAGKVDTHFFEEFSGAVLLTALSAGATAVAGVPSTEVVIGSGASGVAGGVATPFAAFAPVNIPPTIKVAQGTPILIFVQRDLDFAGVGAGK